MTRGRISVESESDELVAHQRWNLHLPSGYLPFYMKPVLDPSAEIPALRLHGLCHHCHLVHHLVPDQGPWKA